MKSPLRMQVRPVHWPPSGPISHWRTVCPMKDCQEVSHRKVRQDAFKDAYFHIDVHRSEMNPAMLALFENPSTIEGLKKFGRSMVSAWKSLAQECVCGHSGYHHQAGKRCTICMMEPKVIKCLQFRPAGVKV